MRLYVCYGTWTAGATLHRHPCGEAHRALRAAGHAPEVVRTYGLGLLPGVVNDLSPGRRRVKEMTGNHWVPVLVSDDGAVVQGSQRIIEWARSAPAPSAGAESAASR